MVGDEGLGRGAARDRVQHRGFHFHETVGFHEAADRRHRGGTRLEGAAGLFAHDQVDIALAILHFLVGQAVELVRQRAQRLGDELELGDLDGQFAGLGLEERPFGTQDIAQVIVLEGGHGFFAGDVTGHVELDAAIGTYAGGILQGGEGRLAHDPLQHHAAGDGDGDRLGFQGFVLEAVVLRMQVGSLVGRTEIVGEGDALFADGRQLGAALGDDAVLVGCRLGGGGVLRGHGWNS